MNCGHAASNKYSGFPRVLPIGTAELTAGVAARCARLACVRSRVMPRAVAGPATLQYTLVGLQTADLGLAWPAQGAVVLSVVVSGE